jgi:hypothetical protein
MLTGWVLGVQVNDGLRATRQLTLLLQSLAACLDVEACWVVTGYRWTLRAGGGGGGSRQNVAGVAAYGDCTVALPTHSESCMGHALFWSVACIGMLFALAGDSNWPAGKGCCAPPWISTIGLCPLARSGLFVQPFMTWMLHCD